MRRERIMILGSMILAGIAAFAAAVDPTRIYVETCPGSVMLDAGQVHQLAATDGTTYRVWIDGDRLKVEAPGYAGTWTLPTDERLSVGLYGDGQDIARFKVLYAQDAVGLVTDAAGPTPGPTPTPVGTPTPPPTPTPSPGSVALVGLDWAGDVSYGKTLGTIRTESTATNIVWTADIQAGEGDYTGWMRIDHPDGGIGVTFLASPDGATYQRLRRYAGSWPMFHLSPSAGRPIPGGDLLTDDIPESGKQVRFRVRISYEVNCVRFQARCWPEGQAEPGEWGADATDCSASPVLTGAVGVWSMGPGAKTWSDLVWTPKGVPAPPTPTLMPLPAECRVFDADSDGDVDLSDYATFQECFSGPR